MTDVTKLKPADKGAPPPVETKTTKGKPPSETNDNLNEPPREAPVKKNQDRIFSAGNNGECLLPRSGATVRVQEGIEKRSIHRHVARIPRPESRITG